MFAIIVPPVATIFLLGVFVPGGTARAAIWTLGAGFALGIILFALGQTGLWPLHFSINVGIAFAACCLIYLAVSRLNPDPPERTAQRGTLVYRRGITAPDAGEHGWRDYRWQSAALAGGMVLILIMFW